MSEKVNDVISRVLQMAAQKIDFLLDSYGKIVFYAQEKKDMKLAKIVESTLDEYADKFQKKTADCLADLRGVRKESK